MWLAATLFGFVNFAVNYLNENKYEILLEIKFGSTVQLGL